MTRATIALSLALASSACVLQTEPAIPSSGSPAEAAIPATDAPVATQAPGPAARGKSGPRGWAAIAESLMKSSLAGDVGQSHLPELVKEAVAELERESDPAFRTVLLLVLAMDQARRKEWDQVLLTTQRAEGEAARVVSPDQEDTKARALISMLSITALHSSGRSEDSMAELDRLVRSRPDFLKDKVRRVKYAEGRARGAFVLPRSYAGKYSDDPRLEAAFSRLERSWPESVGRVRRRLGLPALKIPPVVLVVVDGEGSDIRGWMATHLVGPKERPVGVLSIAAEYQVSDSVDDIRCLAHELGHVLHLAGGGLTEGAPLWLGEGLAHWLECEDESALREMVLDRATHWRGQALRAPLSRLFDSEAALVGADEGDQRICGAVIFFQIERTLGIEGFRALLLRLLREPDGRAAIVDATGMPMPELLAEVKRGFLAWAETVFKGRETLTETLKRADGGDFGGAIADVERFIAESHGSPLVRSARMQRINLLWKSGDLDRALAAARDYATAYPYLPASAGVSMAELGILEEKGEWAAVADLAQRMIRDECVGQPELKASLEGSLARARQHMVPVK